MKYLLDTNACIAYLTQRSAAIARRIANANPKDLALCSIVKYELLYGAHKREVIGEPREADPFLLAIPVAAVRR